MLHPFTHLRPAGTFALAFAGLVAFTACDKDADTADSSVDLQAFITDENEDGDTDRADYGADAAAEVEAHTGGLGLELETARAIDFLLPDGSTKPMIEVGGDMILSPEQYEAELAGGLEGRHYHTNNLVASPQTINVLGYTGSGNALTSAARTGLQWAVNNYNRINTGLTFTLTFGSANYQSYDIVVYRDPDSPAPGVLGRAEFPSGGRPGQYIQLFPALDGGGNNFQEDVITHEMGHAMGLRHTDYATRASCGSGSRGEGVGFDGANYIPGTPSGFDAESIMLGCGNGKEDGEFSFYDVVALEYLY